MFRTPFFSPPLEADNAGFRITEDAHHGRGWTETGEAVGIPQMSGFSHPVIMPDFLTIKTVDSPSIERRFLCCFYPLADTKTPRIVLSQSLKLGGL